MGPKCSLSSKNGWRCIQSHRRRWTLDKSKKCSSPYSIFLCGHRWFLLMFSQVNLINKLEKMNRFKRSFVMTTLAVWSFLIWSFSFLNVSWPPKVQSFKTLCFPKVGSFTVSDVSLPTLLLYSSFLNDPTISTCWRRPPVAKLSFQICNPRPQVPSSIFEDRPD